MLSGGMSFALTSLPNEWFRSVTMSRDSIDVTLGGSMATKPDMYRRFIPGPTLRTFEMANGDTYELGGEVDMSPLAGVESPEEFAEILMGLGARRVEAPPIASRLDTSPSGVMELITSLRDCGLPITEEAADMIEYLYYDG